MTELLLEGVELMVLGMAVVFALLTLLVLAVKGMSQLALSIQGPAIADAAAAPTPEADPEIIAAVTAAVHAHRKRNRNSS